jgi:hypothetical protein
MLLKKRLSKHLPNLLTIHPANFDHRRWGKIHRY